ncbi:polyamine aminopropyltransferase [Candidatus Woesearchaeota archaeon]|jgi:spermidine synthase|nr:polyamine aminopropyltransferase [Candidatus Woesearchaeota archaeon]MBT5272305.1 polyamine aminopropyltransferase [Candidatus Woesearchaeota archaeon]MBT6040634.1 polyamine aminopropyltransferase [Candidatus Woesearchaeota archaeon]MBT6336577.1 polyamine aminopropyltransferase [Candidatus Woesearchaeota archaeon]MBT7927467.1 polyamine aminopropyltransferase [Candidatus Woesearchaeota archaeon]
MTEQTQENNNQEKSKYFVEMVGQSQGYLLKCEHLLYKADTKFQHLSFFKNNVFGNVMQLDNAFQTSEKDEFLYHEPLVQRPMLSHPCPKKVLIIGGGDGGSAEEALKHNCVEKVTMIELDGDVVEKSKEFLQSIHKGAFDHPKMDLKIEDGKKFIEETDEKFDIIILDLTDPVGPSVFLYTKEFYQTIASKLNENGIFSLHTESPLFVPDSFNVIVNTLKSVYKHVKLAFQFVPMYGSVFSYAACSNDIDATTISAEEIDKRIAERDVEDLQLYNGEIHQGIQAMPNYVKENLKKTIKIITMDDTEFPDDMKRYTSSKHLTLDF